MMQVTVSISMQRVQADCYSQDECLTVETKNKEQILCQACDVLRLCIVMQATLKLQIGGPAWRNTPNTTAQSDEVEPLYNVPLLLLHVFLVTSFHLCFAILSLLTENQARSRSFCMFTCRLIQQ